ncbi:hypothetical protein BMF89_05430 [Arthrobacter sp. SRS-W-1-2016]|jgi:hypothetical protein|nr:hypothetical protein BMF89_05430 [Arthrobacter sp. SRS-W-1-2016]
MVAVRAPVIAHFRGTGWMGLPKQKPCGIADSIQRRTLTIGLTAELLMEGQMIAGDVDEQGHHPWPHSTGDAIERITRTGLTEWPDDFPTPRAIVWLANTEAGNRVGREVLAREAQTE